MSGITRDMGTMWLYAKRIGLKIADLGRPILFMKPPVDKPILKPLVQAQCGMPYDIMKSDVIDIAFVSDQLKYTSSETPLPPQIDAKLNLTSYRQNYSSNNIDVPPRIGFFNITSAANTGRQVFGAIAAATYANPNAIFPGDPNYNDSSYARVAFPCLFAFHWVPTSISYDPLVDNIVIVDTPDPAVFTSNTSLASSAIPIDVDITYAQRLNSILPDYGTTRVLEYIFSGQKTWDNYVYDGNWIDRWAWLISTIHSLQFADGLARIQHYLPLFVWHLDSGNLTDFTTDLTDLNNVYYRDNQSDPYDNNHFGNKDAIISRPDLYNPVYWRVERFGYAWSLGKHTTKSLALVVVLLHTVLVLCHIGMVWWRNWRCYAWSTPLELMLLALRSPIEPSEAVLKGTASGVEDRRTFGDVVRIREGEHDGSVMLVVERNEEMNVEYAEGTAYAGHELGYFEGEGQVRMRGRLKPGVKYL